MIVTLKYKEILRHKNLTFHRNIPVKVTKLIWNELPNKFLFKVEHESEMQELKSFATPLKSTSILVNGSHLNLNYLGVSLYIAKYLKSQKADVHYTAKKDYHSILNSCTSIDSCVEPSELKDLNSQYDYCVRIPLESLRSTNPIEAVGNKLNFVPSTEFPEFNLSKKRENILREHFKNRPIIALNSWTYSNQKYKHQQFWKYLGYKLLKAGCSLVWLGDKTDTLGGNYYSIQNDYSVDAWSISQDLLDHFQIGYLADYYVGVGDNLNVFLGYARQYGVTTDTGNTLKFENYKYSDSLDPEEVFKLIDKRVFSRGNKSRPLELCRRKLSIENQPSLVFDKESFPELNEAITYDQACDLDTVDLFYTKHDKLEKRNLSNFGPIVVSDKHKYNLSENIYKADAKSICFDITKSHLGDLVIFTALIEKVHWWYPDATVFIKHDSCHTDLVRHLKYQSYNGEDYDLYISPHLYGFHLENRDVFDFVGVNIDEINLKLKYTKQLVNKSKIYVFTRQSINTPYKSKEWAVGNWLNLTKKLEQKGHIVEEIVYENDPILAHSYRTISFQDTARKLEDATACITIDSFPYHLVNYLKIPNVCIMGGASLPHLIKYPKSIHAISPTYSCSYSIDGRKTDSKTCCRTGVFCTRDITVDLVIEKLDLLLKGKYENT